ncbi:phosphopantetheine-binding protein [Streptomyces hirsutus]
MLEKSAESLTTVPDESGATEHRTHSPSKENSSSTDAEKDLAEILAGVLCVEQVPVDSNFFDDLGANSLVMAQFCARVRKRADLPSVSIKDIYRYRTIRSLAAALTDAGTGIAATPAPVSPPDPASSEAVNPIDTLQYILCGTLQFLLFLGYSFIAAILAARGYAWISVGSNVADIYLRSVIFGGAGFVGMCTFPIVAKWILIGQWKERSFPVWGLTYLRFWTVKVLLHANPMVFFVGNPLYVLYLRALGARIGTGVTILSRNVPVCTDLLTIGAGTVIRKESFFLCYRAHAGRIQTGPVTLGRNVFIGEKTVLDVATSMGDGAQLGHASSLHSNQAVPGDQRWHGSPAQRTELDYVRIPPARCGTLRRVGFGLATVGQLFFLSVPLAVGGLYILLTEVPSLNERLGPGGAGLVSSELYVDALLLSCILFFSFVVVSIVVLFTVPRLLNLFVKPGKVYSLYGFHYSMHRAIARITNVKFFTWLFGDSSYIVHYLRGLGYDLSQVEQTGSNFGTEVQHETPYLCSVGSGTMIADGLSIVNADFSSTSFRVSRASIGRHNFLGNNIVYPSGAKNGRQLSPRNQGDGSTRWRGTRRGGSAWLAVLRDSRSVERDLRFDHMRAGAELRRNLAAKNRFNIRSMVLFLLVRWFFFFVITVLALADVELYGSFGYAALRHRQIALADEDRPAVLRHFAVATVVRPPGGWADPAGRAGGGPGRPAVRRQDRPRSGRRAPGRAVVPRSRPDVPGAAPARAARPGGCPSPVRR